MLSNPSNFQQNPLESQLNKEDTLYFRQNACVNEIGHLNFKQIPSTQEIKKICEFRDAHKIPVLENKHRTILAKALISYILKNNPNQMLKAADFTHLAQSIVYIFPSELKETYFVPSQKGHVSRGKLFDAYHNTRTRLRALGVVSGRPKSKFSNHTSESGSDSEEIPANSSHSQQKSHDTPELNLEQALTFFQTNDCVIKEENLSIEEEFPKIKEEFPCIEEDNFSIEEEYPSFSQDINFLLRGDNYENLPSTEVIKQIFEFQEVLNLPALQNKHRISISKALIAFLLNDYPDRRLVREDFLQLAQSIVEIFPAEVIETYYIPFQNGKLARGKLFIAYSNRRAQFRNEGVIPKRTLSASESNNADNSRSMLSATESSRDLDDTLSNSGDFQQNSFETSESLLKVTTAPFSQTNAGFGESPGPLKFGQPYFYKQLPTTQEIRKIWDFQVALKVPKLENKHRNNMAKSLIGFILKNKPNRRLGRDDFLRLAQSIVDIFPSEITETYYVPFEKGHLARGKLYMAYNNIKARLAAAGIISRRSKSKVENPTAENSVSSLTASESGSDQEEILTSTSNSLQNCFEISESLLEEQTTYFIQAQSAVSETSNDQFSEVFNFSLPSNNFSQLPTTEEIRQIYVIQDVLKVQTLENKHRTSIAKAVILYVLRNEPNKRLVREDFLQLVESIVEIFPTEVKETYYIPFQKGQLARGKLYDAYNNAKSRLGAAGLITRRVKNKVENNAPKTVNISNTSINLGDPIESDFEIFKSDCPEWSSVLTSWKRTHAFRQNELQTKTLSIAEYFDKYKVLYNEKSYELFDIDFKILYPTSKSIYEWKLYYEKILQKSKLMRSAQEILTWIQNADSEDLKLALSLTLVCYLLPNSRKRKKSEIQESFICYCKDIDDNEIEHRVKRIKVETEPRVILFGDSNDAITFAYVDICGIRLKFENPMKAVEVCFQSFMVLNIKYPKYCSHVWLFMQKMIFDVNTPEDVVFPAINTLINDLQPDIQK